MLHLGSEFTAQIYPTNNCYRIHYSFHMSENTVIYSPRRFSVLTQRKLLIGWSYVEPTKTYNYKTTCALIEVLLLI